jgi:hypothetical protein
MTILSLKAATIMTFLKINPFNDLKDNNLQKSNQEELLF